MDKLKAFAENFGKFLPLGTAFLLALSLTNLYVYYYQFGVNIADYVGVSEIVLIAIINIATVGTLLIPPVLLYLVTYQSRPTPAQIRKGTRIYTTLFVIIAVAVMTLFTLNICYPTNSLSTIALVIGIELALILPVLQYQRDRLNSVENSFYHLFKLLLVWIFALVLYITTKVNAVKSGYHNSVVSILLKDSTRIGTNDSINYIGKTNSHYFFYNIKQHKTLLFSSQDVQQVDIIK